MSFIRSTVTCGIALFVMASATLAQDHQREFKEVSEIDEYLARAMGATNGYELGDANNEYMGLFSADELEFLTSQENASVALAAKWELVCRTIPTEGEERDEPIEVDSKALARFLGFVEGRSRVDLPDWWQHSVLEIKAYDRRRFAVLSERPPAARSPFDDRPIESYRAVAQKSFPAARAVNLIYMCEQYFASAPIAIARLAYQRLLLV